LRTALRRLADAPNAVLVLLHALLWLGPVIADRRTPLALSLIGICGVFVSFGVVGIVRLIRAVEFRDVLTSQMPEVAADFTMNRTADDWYLIPEISRASRDVRVVRIPDLRRLGRRLKAATWTMWAGIGVSILVGLVGRVTGVVLPRG
jgi:hypothetical protein